MKSRGIIVDPSIEHTGSRTAFRPEGDSTWCSCGFWPTWSPRPRVHGLLRVHKWPMNTELLQLLEGAMWTRPMLLCVCPHISAVSLNKCRNSSLA